MEEKGNGLDGLIFGGMGIVVGVYRLGREVGNFRE